MDLKKIILKLKKYNKLIYTNLLCQIKKNMDNFIQQTLIIY